MMQLPTKTQITAVSDVAALRGIKDEVELSIVHIETQLQYRADDQVWAKSATNALALHRYTDRLLGRRIDALARQAPKDAPPERPDSETHSLTLETILQGGIVDATACTNTQAVDEALQGITARINAVEDDRDDEIGLPVGDRDQRFLSATARVLRELRASRMALQTRRGQLTRAERKDRQHVLDQTRERLFVDAAREVLGRPTYEALWARVDEIEAAQARAAHG